MSGPGVDVMRDDDGLDLARDLYRDIAARIDSAKEWLDGDPATACIDLAIEELDDLLEHMRRRIWLAEIDAARALTS